MKKYVCASMCIGLCSVASVLAIAPASFASSVSVSANAAQSSETLRQGLPGRRLGGGTRSDRFFVNNYAYLTALTTADNLSVTAAARPSLLFFVPEMVKETTVEFVLRDANDELVYDTTFEVAAEGGVVTVDTALAAEMTDLAVDQNYQWYFSVIPDMTDRANDIAVHGYVRRVDQSEWLAQQGVEAAVVSDMGSLAPLEKAQFLYQQGDLWHDAAILLSDLRRNDPDNGAIASEWSHLLESAGLVTVAHSNRATVQLSSN